MSDPFNEAIDRLEASVDRVAAQTDMAFEQAAALLVIQLSMLGQQPQLRAKLDAEQRVNLRFLCEELARVLKEEAGE